ncbi:MAG: hypothetical protein LC109_05400 [Bacteroidia bacterium]|nr:hypothetical protein [Bacteroidia bacterium]
MTNIEPIQSDFTSSEFDKNKSIKDIIKEDIIFKHIQEDNFLLGIIETVTISDIVGVGKTLYYAYEPYEYIKETIHSDYEKIIEDINKTQLTSPINYHSWYERDKHYYVIDKNNNCELPTYNILESHIGTLKNLEENHADIKKDKNLTSTDLEEFYKTYTKCFLNKDWFKKIPHYFILAKPISIKDENNNSFIPLGNMYVVIGTKNKVEIGVYQEIVKSLRRLWFQQNGHKILQEHLEKKRSDLYRPPKEKSVAIDTRLKAVASKEHKKKKGNFPSLNDFYYAAFDLRSSHTELKDKYLINSEWSIIKTLIYNYNDKNKISNELISYKNKSKDLDTYFLEKTAESSTLSKIDEDSIKYFLLLLSRRRLALALCLVFNFKENEVHHTFIGQALTENNSEDAIRRLFKTALFIIGHSTIKDMASYLSQKDKDFLEDIKKEIRRIDPNFTCFI